MLARALINPGSSKLQLIAIVQTKGAAAELLDAEALIKKWRFTTAIKDR